MRAAIILLLIMISNTFSSVSCGFAPLCYKCTWQYYETYSNTSGPEQYSFEDRLYYTLNDTETIGDTTYCTFAIKGNMPWDTGSIILSLVRNASCGYTCLSYLNKLSSYRFFNPLWKSNCADDGDTVGYSNYIPSEPMLQPDSANRMQLMLKYTGQYGITDGYWSATYRQNIGLISYQFYTHYMVMMNTTERGSYQLQKLVGKDTSNILYSSIEYPFVLRRSIKNGNYHVYRKGKFISINSISSRCIKNISIYSLNGQLLKKIQYAESLNRGLINDQFNQPIIITINNDYFQASYCIVK